VVLSTKSYRLTALQSRRLSADHQNTVYHNVTADEELDGAALSGQIVAEAPCWRTMFIRILAGTTTINDWTKKEEEEEPRTPRG
jgi:hypothetical protein